MSFVVEFQGGVHRLLNGRTYDQMPIAAAVQQSAWRTETTSNDKQRGHPDGALFCLAEFASLLSLRLLHPPGQNRAWLGTPNLHPTARSARWGPRAYGVWNCSDVPLTQALSLIALCATRERTWANFFRA